MSIITLLFMVVLVGGVVVVMQAPGVFLLILALIVYGLISAARYLKKWARSLGR